MSGERVVYSVQSTYIITRHMNAGKTILTCDRRIDIPTIEPLTGMISLVNPDEFLKVIPCIELAGNFFSDPKLEFDFELEFETNEGVTVLPVKIDPGWENPYQNPRYVLVLPRGTTGVKSCKVVYRYSGEVVQHNLTFGVMPPPYNYDNALFSYLSCQLRDALVVFRNLNMAVANLTTRVKALENKAGV